MSTKTHTKDDSKRRGLIAAAIAIVLMLVAVFATLAYLNFQTKTVDNVMTVGQVSATLDEAPVDEWGVVQPGDRVDVGQKYHLLPGLEYTKDPTMHVDANSEESYAYVVVQDDLASPKCEAEDTPTILEQMTKNGWKELTGVIPPKGLTGKVYYLDTTVKPSPTKTDLPVFSKFKIKDNLSTEQLKTLDNAIVGVTGLLIQSHGFDTAADAYNAVYPNTDPTNCTVTFEYNSGDHGPDGPLGVTKQIIVEKGKAPGIDNVPDMTDRRAGHTFLGWCTNQACTEPADPMTKEKVAETVISDNTQYYAKWDDTLIGPEVKLVWNPTQEKKADLYEGETATVWVDSPVVPDQDLQLSDDAASHYKTEKLSNHVYKITGILKTNDPSECKASIHTPAEAGYPEKTTEFDLKPVVEQTYTITFECKDGKVVDGEGSTITTIPDLPNNTTVAYNGETMTVTNPVTGDEKTYTAKADAGKKFNDWGTVAPTTINTNITMRPQFRDFKSFEVALNSNKTEWGEWIYTDGTAAYAANKVTAREDTTVTLDTENNTVTFNPAVEVEGYATPVATFTATAKDGYKCAGIGSTTDLITSEGQSVNAMFIPETGAYDVTIDLNGGYYDSETAPEGWTAVGTSTYIKVFETVPTLAEVQADVAANWDVDNKVKKDGYKNPSFNYGSYDPDTNRVVNTLWEEVITPVEIEGLPTPYPDGTMRIIVHKATTNDTKTLQLTKSEGSEAWEVTLPDNPQGVESSWDVTADGTLNITYTAGATAEAGRLEGQVTIKVEGNEKYKEVTVPLYVDIVENGTLVEEKKDAENELVNGKEIKKAEDLLDPTSRTGLPQNELLDEQRADIATKIAAAKADAEAEIAAAGSEEQIQAAVDKYNEAVKAIEALAEKDAQDTVTGKTNDKAAVETQAETAVETIEEIDGKYFPDAETEAKIKAQFEDMFNAAEVKDATKNAIDSSTSESDWNKANTDYTALKDDAVTRVSYIAEEWKTDTWTLTPTESTIVKGNSTGLGADIVISQTKDPRYLNEEHGTEWKTILDGITATGHKVVDADGKDLSDIFTLAIGSDNNLTLTVGAGAEAKAYTVYVQATLNERNTVGEEPFAAKTIVKSEAINITVKEYTVSLGEATFTYADATTTTPEGWTYDETSKIWSKPFGTKAQAQADLQTDLDAWKATGLTTKGGFEWNTETPWTTTLGDNSGSALGNFVPKDPITVTLAGDTGQGAWYNTDTPKTGDAPLTSISVQYGTKLLPITDVPNGFKYTDNTGAEKFVYAVPNEAYTFNSMDVTLPTDQIKEAKTVTATYDLKTFDVAFDPNSTTTAVPHGAWKFYGPEAKVMPAPDKINVGYGTTITPSLDKQNTVVVSDPTGHYKGETEFFAAGDEGYEVDTLTAPGDIKVTGKTIAATFKQIQVTISFTTTDPANEASLAWTDEQGHTPTNVKAFWGTEANASVANGVGTVTFRDVNNEDRTFKVQGTDGWDVKQLNYDGKVDIKPTDTPATWNFDATAKWLTCDVALNKSAGGAWYKSADKSAGEAPASITVGYGTKIEKEGNKITITDDTGIYEGSEYYWAVPNEGFWMNGITIETSPFKVDGTVQASFAEQEQATLAFAQTAQSGTVKNILTPTSVTFTGATLDPDSKQEIEYTKADGDLHFSVEGTSLTYTPGENPLAEGSYGVKIHGKAKASDDGHWLEAETEIDLIYTVTVEKGTTKVQFGQDYTGTGTWDTTTSTQDVPIGATINVKYPETEKSIVDTIGDFFTGLFSANAEESNDTIHASATVYFTVNGEQVGQDVKFTPSTNCTVIGVTDTTEGVVTENTTIRAQGRYVLAIPTAVSTSLTFNKSDQTLYSNYNSTYMNISGDSSNGKGLHAKTYTCSFSIKDGYGRIFSDGSYEVKNVSKTINQATWNWSDMTLYFRSDLSIDNQVWLEFHHKFGDCLESVVVDGTVLKINGSTVTKDFKKTFIQNEKDGTKWAQDVYDYTRKPTSASGYAWVTVKIHNDYKDDISISSTTSTQVNWS